MSPSITSTLAFILCTTLFPITKSTRNRKYKREKSKTTNLNYPKEKKLPSKLHSRTLFPELWKSQGIYRPRGASGELYGVVRRNSTHDSRVWPQKCGHGHVSAAILWPGAHGRISAAILWPGAQRQSLQVIATLMSGYGLQLPCFLLPAAAEWAFKVNGSIRI